MLVNVKLPLSSYEVVMEKLQLNIIDTYQYDVIKLFY